MAKFIAIKIYNIDLTYLGKPKVYCEQRGKETSE